tara:strand:+ start:269 stop:865 length:597 start_codon:yes stop_codon:yes gene_type:complete
MNFGQSPDVTLRIEPGKITLNNRYSRSQIKTLSGRGPSSVKLGSRWQPIGLTLTEQQFSMRVKVDAKRIGSDRFCGQLSRVDARLGYDKLKVYIARKYRPGSCNYRSILDHENRHVSVFRNTLVKYAPRVERRLRRFAASLGPVVATSADQAAKILQQKLQRELKPLIREMDREMDFRNAKLDSPQNYRREQARCSQW